MHCRLPEILLSSLWMCGWVDLGTACILTGIIGDLDLFYFTVSIYLRLLTWLCLLLALQLHLHCPCSAPSSTVDNVELTYLPIGPLPPTLSDHMYTRLDKQFPYWHKMKLFQLKGKSALFLSTFTGLSSLRLYVYNWNLKVDYSHAFNFLYAIKYVCLSICVQLKYL